MTRENAIKFLRDISMGIEYLENTYSMHPQSDQSTGRSPSVNLVSNSLMSDYLSGNHNNQ